jgi:hypothetical protein
MKNIALFSRPRTSPSHRLILPQEQAQIEFKEILLKLCNTAIQTILIGRNAIFFILFGFLPNTAVLSNPKLCYIICVVHRREECHLKIERSIYVHTTLLFVIRVIHKQLLFSVMPLTA